MLRLAAMASHVDKAAALRTVALFNTRETPQGPVRLALRGLPSDCRNAIYIGNTMAARKEGVDFALDP